MKDYVRVSTFMMALLMLILPVFSRQENQGFNDRGKNKSTIKPGEMKRILDRAAQYCEKIEKSAFHFFCYEKVSETRTPLSSTGNISPLMDQSFTSSAGRRDLAAIRGEAHTQINKYEYKYRLKKIRDTVKEERQPVSSKDGKQPEGETVITPQTFLSNQVVFAPGTLLGRFVQHEYHYRFIRFDKRNDRQVVVIEVMPKKPGETTGIYGNVWIDMEDFSVLKIQADPGSIVGYRLLEENAKKLKAKLYLSLEAEFDEIHQGIRFPTKVSILEKYRGGPIIPRYRGQKKWERTRIQFKYNDYQFFDVETDVMVH
jgi:hypothetical protein